MTSREQTLALVLIGATILIGGGAGGYMLIWQPLQRQKAAEEALNKEIAELQAQVDGQRAIAQRLADARTRSLPADESLARREYTVALEHLVEGAGVPKGYTITPKTVDNSSKAVPEIAKGKPVYTRVAYELTFKKADMWAIKDFLQAYYRLGLLQQITAITIKKEEDPGAKNAGKRNDLTVTLTTEAILVDGAETRRTLLPVPTAFAAIGGGAIHKGMTLIPEAGRGVRTQVPVSVLSPVGRDYTLMVLKDPFNGPLPPPPPFKLAKIPDVKIKPDERPAAVKVPISGAGADGATITAIAEKGGTLFAPGALKVDQKAQSIELPKTSATEGSSLISVIATSADGKEEKGSFKVSLSDEWSESKKNDGREDIAPFILLIGVAQQSNGSAWARICDTFNRSRYQIDATRTGIKVGKEEIWRPNKGWETVESYKHPPGVLVISDAASKTRRTFKVIAVDHEGLILADIKPGEAAPRPGGKGPRPDRPAKQGPADPVAALGGNMIVVPPQPKFYRWTVGQSLAALKPIPNEEGQKILKQAEADGPVFGGIAMVP
jgi:hypothetical protein